MTRWSRYLVLILLLAAWLRPGPANGFSRSRDPDNSGICLWWPERLIVYYVNEDCSEDVSNESCLQAVRTSTDVWNAVDCSDFELAFGGTTPEREVGFDQANWNDNINLIVWYEEQLPDDIGRSIIALATTTYDHDSGEVVDNDLEVNGVHYMFSTPGSGSISTDIQNTLVHEMGHFVGLDHSADLEASMYESAERGETHKRDLAEDDRNGICYLYPSGGPVPPCEQGVCMLPDSEGGQDCVDSQDCPAETVCRDGTCGRPCDNDGDCFSGEICQQPPGNNGDCQCGGKGSSSLALLLFFLLGLGYLARTAR